MRGRGAEVDSPTSAAEAGAFNRRGTGAELDSPTSAAEAGALNRKLAGPHRGSLRAYGVEPVELPDSIDVRRLALAVRQGFEGGGLHGGVPSLHVCGKWRRE